MFYIPKWLLSQFQTVREGALQANFLILFLFIYFVFKLLDCMCIGYQKSQLFIQFLNYSKVQILLSGTLLSGISSKFIYSYQSKSKLNDIFNETIISNIECDIQSYLKRLTLQSDQIMQKEPSEKTVDKSEVYLQTRIVSHYLSQKAGMAQVDKKAIQAKVEAMTKGTPKDIHNRQMQVKREAQIQIMLKKVESFSHEQREEMKASWNTKIQQFEASRDLTRYWAHLDFDMFYVACELLEKYIINNSRPELKDKPCAVGSKDGVLCTANYEARKYGVRSALPTFIAIKLCPQLVLIPLDFSKYKRYSQIFRNILSQFDQNLESHGLDQAYIEITDHVKHLSHQETEAFVQKLRHKIFQKTNLTVSCGVGANKMLAKLASQQKKPDDQYILQNEAECIKNFMKSKTLRKIPGIGPVNEYYLKGLKIENVQQILENMDILGICFSQPSAIFYASAAIGLGCNQHQFSQRKSVGKSQTFKVTTDQQFLRQKLKQLCSGVSLQLQQLGLLTINVVFSYQNQKYVKKDRTVNLVKYTTRQEDLYQACYKQFKSIKEPLRLLGVRCSSIIKQTQLNKLSIQTFMNNRPKRNDDQKTQLQKTKDWMMGENLAQEKGRMMCPICSQSIACKGNLVTFNRHIDKCLSGQIEEKEKLVQRKSSNSQKFERRTNQKMQQQVKKQSKSIKKVQNNYCLTDFLKKG